MQRSGEKEKRTVQKNKDDRQNRKAFEIQIMKSPTYYEALKGRRVSRGKRRRKDSQAGGGGPLGSKGNASS